MHQLRLQAIAILTLLTCGSAAAIQEKPETPTSLAPTMLAPGNQDPKQVAPDTLSASSSQPYNDKLKSDSRGDSQPSQSSNERIVGSDTIWIAWSEKLDELRGFSTKIGDWEILKISPQKSIVPSVATSVALVELEGAIAGFSATKCCWDVIELPKGVRAQILVDTSVLTVQTPDHIYTFASEKGRWTSPTDPEFQPMSESITVSDSAKMKHGGIYDQFQKWLESLPKHKAKGISLTGEAGIVRLDATRQSSMKAAKQKLAEWGYISNGSTGQSSVGDLATSLKSKSKDTTLSAVSVDVLRGELEKLEAKIVDQLRSGEDSQDPKSKLAELRPQAEKAFDLRQQVLRLESQRLQAKLRSIEESLQAREKNRDDLISKRLKELGDSPKPKAQANKLDQPTQAIAAQPTTIVQASGNYFEQVTSIAKTLRAIRHSVVQTRENLNRCDQEIMALDSQLAALAEKITNGNLDKGIPKAEAQKEALQLKRVEKGEVRKIWGQELELEMKKWKQAWKSYNQQVELLNLEVEKKRNELPFLNQTRDNNLRLKEKGIASASQVDQAERNLNRADIELREATQIVELFRQIAVDEPELNPEHDQK